MTLAKLKPGDTVWVASHVVTPKTVEKVGRKWAHLARKHVYDHARILLGTDDYYETGQVVGGERENSYAAGVAFLTEDDASRYLRRKVAWAALKNEWSRLSYISSDMPPEKASLNWLEQTARVMQGLER